ncbi:MAG: hypothetical protein JW729_11225 [Bacteroidales bacterium]|nr:hypothetical protein [Bacteroidales bacterium]
MTKKILKISGRTTHAYLFENRTNTHDNLVHLCKFMRVSAGFLLNYQPYISQKYILSSYPLKAIPIAAS